MSFPRVLPIRERAAVVRHVLEERLETILPLAMREAGIDMWIVLCQEDDYDPVFQTLMPMGTWAPIVQMLVFCDDGGDVQRTSISRTNTQGLYEQPWSDQDDAEQWTTLRGIVEERKPRRIGINTGSIQWAAGGLTHNLYLQLVEALGPEWSARLVSAEPLVTRWLSTLTDTQINLFSHVVNVAHAILAECFSREVIVPGVTTTQDLEWHYWQRVADLGLELAFKPFFRIQHRPAFCEQFGEGDSVIRPGDVLHSDVGIKYLGLNSDHQQVAYVLLPGETGAPAGLRSLMAAANKLQDIFLSEFRQGLTGNELLANMLTRARAEGVPGPRIYSHCLGHFLHQPGPLIGLPWEQECNPGRGDVVLEHNYSFTMELCVSGPVPEWDGEEVRIPVEEDVVFSESGCRVVDGRQTELHLI